MRFVPLLLLFFLLATCGRPTKNTVVAIQPIGHVSAGKIETARLALYEGYHCNVIILPPVEAPRNAFVNIKTPRYRADKLIAWLKDNRPDTVDYIMGLTGYDISITKKDMLGRIKEPQSLYADFGIFGLGYKPGKSCIVSYYRLGEDAVKAKDRLAKISIHELGHNLGLDHCPDKNCVMTDAVEKITTIDNAEMKLCEKCRLKLD